jgi:hypothetical protein
MCSEGKTVGVCCLNGRSGILSDLLDQSLQRITHLLARSNSVEDPLFEHPAMLFAGFRIHWTHALVRAPGGARDPDFLFFA